MSKATELAGRLYDNEEVPSLEDCSQAASHLRALDASHRQLLEALEKIKAMEDTEENEWDAVERILPEIMGIASTAIAAAKELA